MRARDVMTSPVITVTPAVPLKGATALTVSHGFTALPVVDEDKRLLGIVTEADLVRVIARADTTVAAEVQRVLDMYGGGREWTVTVHEGEAVIGAATTDEDTERVLVALADAVPGVLRARVLTGGQR